MSNVTMTDGFNGDNTKLCGAIDALLSLDARGAMSAHGIGEHARTLLTACAARLRGEAAACQTCNGHGMIGGPSFYAPDEGGVPCPDCTLAAQGEQQAVAFSLRFSDGEVNAMTTFSTQDKAESYAAQCINSPEVVPLYTRPQPVAVAEWLVTRPGGSKYRTDAGGADMARKRAGYKVEPVTAVMEALERISAFKPLNNGVMQSDDSGKWYHRDSIIAALSAAPAAQRYNNPDDLSQFAAPAPVAGDAVAKLPERWRNLAEGFRDGTDIGNAEAACLIVSANELDVALSAEPAAPGRTLYIDLDGVMADFDGAFPAIFGLDHRSLADEEMWSRINGHASFFRDLPPMQGAIDFFRSVEHLQPVILTACPKSNYVHVAGQKRAWVREHLSQTCLVLPVLGGRHKALFMHQAGDVLIDDWGKNCVAWTEAGGVAIKHEGDWIDTRAALSNVMRELSGAPAAPSAARALTGPNIGGATEAAAIVQDGGEG